MTTRRRASLQPPPRLRPAASDTAAATSTAAGPALKVGLATDQGGLNDKGFNQLAFQGATKAKDELGITLEVKESKSEADYVPNLTYFCDNDFDVIIAIGFLMAPTVGQLAPKCADAQFAIVDNSVVGDPINAAPNVTGLLFKEQETGYLVGYLAGLVDEEQHQGQRLQGRLVRRRPEDPAGRPVHRRLPEGRGRRRTPT